MRSERCVLVGIDLGTSAVKVIATTSDGASVASASATYPLETPRPQWVEQDANIVYRATMRVLRDVLAEVALRGDEVQAIGFSCAMHGLLPVDAQGEPLGPLVTWMDRRSAAIADRWHADGTAARLYAQTGAPVHPMLPSCKVRWFAEHDPHVSARAAKFVSIKELIVYRWTGEWLVDWGMASGTGLFDFRTHDWSSHALEVAGIGADKLSRPVAPRSVVRGLRAGVASGLGISAATAIVPASSDGALANLGVGAIEPGELALTLGTSGAIRTVVDRPVLDERARTFCYAFDDDGFVVGGPTSSAGAVLAAIHGLFLSELEPDARFAAALACAERAERGAKGLIVLPFLSGERAPYWMSELRGGMFGLDLSHTRNDVLRAAFESVVFALFAVWNVMREQLTQASRIRLSGGLTHAPFVRQLVADVFGCVSIRENQEEASAYGAALMAGLAIGALADRRAARATLRTLDEHVPDATATDAYARIFARYESAVAANLPLFTAASAQE